MFSVPIVEQVRRNKVACEIAMNKQAGAQPSGVNVRHGDAFPEKPLRLRMGSCHTPKQYEREQAITGF